jgi:hypothetical protein
MRRVPRLLALAAAALAVSAGAASASGTTVGWVSAPSHIVQGNPAHVAVRVLHASACTLGVRYHGGSAQRGLGRVQVIGGFAQWTWEIPTEVQAGAAKASVRCAGVSVSRRFVVVGRVPAPKIVVVDSGFTTRTDTSGSTRLSYGLILHNTAGDRDAVNVSVQTNFVLADDHLLGTDTRRVPGLPAGGNFAFGNTVYFPGAAPIARLEFVVHVDGFQPRRVVLPTLANIHLEPQPSQPQWLGTIEGEVQNTSPTLTLQNAAFSAVVLDAGGAIIGGTSSGYLTQALPAGARSFLKMSSLDVIPSDRAASAVVSIWPTWIVPS